MRYITTNNRTILKYFSYTVNRHRYNEHRKEVQYTIEYLRNKGQYTLPLVRDIGRGRNRWESD
jgi:hypothetical protein